MQLATQHIQHMHKALTQMNLQIHHVISDLTGLTGMSIIDAIVAGERDATVWAKLRDRRVKASEETIRKSLVGNWRDEHLFTLEQSRDLFRAYQKQVVACEEKMAELLARFQPRVDPDEKPLPPDRKKNRSGHKKRRQKGGSESVFDLRTEAYKLFGVDVTQIPGLETLPLPLFSELGRDMNRWPSEGNFISWLMLCWFQSSAIPKPVTPTTPRAIQFLESSMLPQAEPPDTNIASLSL